MTDTVEISMKDRASSIERSHRRCNEFDCGSLSCTMEVFSLLKQTLSSDNVNPITKYFEVGKQIGSAGPEMVWKIFDAVRLEDKKDATVFIFEKKIADKLHKPRRRETVAEILRREVHQLERIKHPRILHVLHTVEECHDSLAFATEPVSASLSNMLGNHERMPANVPQSYKENDFIEMETKYGILQITEALSYLHITEQILHRNVCPQSILLTKRGCWKLAGLGFAEKAKDGKDLFPCQPWTTKLSKMAQPDLNYTAPEIQMDKNCTTLSDMFSLGILICSIYNSGKSLIEAEHSPSLYTKKLDQMHDIFGKVAHKMPMALVEPVEKMINRDVRYRPSAQVFSSVKYFQDAIVSCLQHLDMIEHQDAVQKIEFYCSLVPLIPSVPKFTLTKAKLQKKMDNEEKINELVQKILYKHIFPILLNECKSADVTAALSPMLTLIDFATRDEYNDVILNDFRTIMAMPKPIQATCYLLDKLDVVVAKTPRDEIKTEVLPLVFNTLDSNSLQGQEAALNAIGIIKEYVDGNVIKKMVLPRAKNLFARSTNVKMRINALTCINKLLDSLDKMIILDEVLPFLTDISCQDAEVIMNIVGIYNHMLRDKRFGLTHNLVATKVMPPLIPHTVNPGLNMDQFSELMAVLREMLDQIDKQRWHKMKLETLAVPVPKSLSKHSDNSSAADDKSGNLLSISDIQNIQKARNGFPKNKNPYNVRQHFLGSTKVPSTPELHLCPHPSPKSQRRNHSLQSLGSSLDEKSCLERPMDMQRRYSLVPPTSAVPGISLITDDGATPSPDYSRRPSTQSLGPFMPPVSAFDRLGDLHRRPSAHSLGVLPIGISGEWGDRPRRPSTHSLGMYSLNYFGEDGWSRPGSRRPSTHSLGPIIVPEFDRRGSRGSLFGGINVAEFQSQRRPSFQSIGESVMQLFTGK